MKEEVKKAVDYAIDSNKLEDYHLTDKEVETVLGTINESDEKFTDDVLEMIAVDKTIEKENDSNVKIRK